MTRRLPWAVFVSLLALACDDGGDDGPSDEMNEPDARQIADAALPDGGRPDVRPPDRHRDAGDDGPDARPSSLVEDCDDVCDRYESCEQLEAVWGGDRDACAAACAESEPSARFPIFLICVQDSACEDIDDCELPPKPPPSCAEVCEAALACEFDGDLSLVVPEFADCSVLCDDASLNVLVGACGRPIVDDEVCDEAAFVGCVLGDVAPDCFELCVASGGCDEAVDEVACTAECLVEENADPVSARRAQQRRGCIIAAPDCDSLAACDLPGTIWRGEAGLDDLCAADAACGFFGDECAEVADAALARLADGAIDCLAAGFAADDEDCGGPAYACFEPAPIGPAVCDEHCLVSQLCGLLPEGQTEGACAEACRELIGGGDGSTTEALGPELACAFEPNCDAVEDCRQAVATVTPCAAYCARRVECELEDVETCEVRCEVGLGARRGLLARACTLAAATCDGVGRCEPPPPPDCAAVCGRLDVCELASETCAVDCDDAHFDDPTGHLPRLACLAATGNCDRRAECEEGDLSGGRACLSWCSLQIECSDEPSPMSLIECVEQCGAGIAGADGLAFELSVECFDGLEPDAGCDSRAACLASADADDHCEPHCASLERCLLDDDAEACGAVCVGVADDFVEPALCTLRAERREEGCRRIAECAGIEVEPPTPACVDLCDRRSDCDTDVDAFLCEQQCIPEPEGTPVRAACADLAECGELDVCLEAEGVVPDACARACEALAGCAGAVGEDALWADTETCMLECAGSAILDENPDFASAAESCAADIADGQCDAQSARVCFDAPICAQSWHAVDECQLQLFFGDDPAVYIAECAQNLSNDPGIARQAQCLIDLAASAGGDPLICSLGVFQCFF